MSTSASVASNTGVYKVLWSSGIVLQRFSVNSSPIMYRPNLRWLLINV